MKDSILGKLQAMANKAGNNKKAILERINDIEKRLKVNNDLLETSPEKNRRLLEACKTAKAVVKYGMTSKALKLVANNNLKLREDLCIDIQEYMILPLFIISPNEIYDVEKLCYLVGGQNNYIDILKILFRMYEKHILRVSIDQDISFNISLALRTYLQETKEFKVVARTLKDVIRDVDAIANLYNNTETFAQIAQRQITKILEEYRGEFDFCQMMLDLRHSCEEYPFVWYCLCHCILNGCSIDRESDLINMWVHHDASRAEIVNYVFNNDNAYIFTKPTDIIWEPFAGDGRLIKNFANQKIISDILAIPGTIKHDYIKEQDFKYDIIYTNPGFSVATKAFEKMLSAGKPFGIYIPDYAVPNKPLPIREGFYTYSKEWPNLPVNNSSKNGFGIVFLFVDPRIQPVRSIILKDQQNRDVLLELSSEGLADLFDFGTSNFRRYHPQEYGMAYNHLFKGKYVDGTIGQFVRNSWIKTISYLDGRLHWWTNPDGKSVQKLVHSQKELDEMIGSGWIKGRKQKISKIRRKD